jgi:hypothetical protein
MPNPKTLAGGVYIHDTGKSLCIQVRGPLEGNLVPELMQIWETSRSIGHRSYLLDLKAAGPVSTEGMEALDFLRVAGVRLLWPDDAHRTQGRRPLLAALRTFLGENVFCR